MFSKVWQNVYLRLIHTWPAFLAEIPIFGILVNILVTKIMNVLAKCFIFSTKNLFGDNIELVDFHSNRLIGIVAGAHKKIVFFCVL